MEDERYKLRRMLPHGALKEVADRANVSRSAVYKFFGNKSNSTKIEMAAIDIAIMYKKRKKTALRKIIDE
ncbi:MAG: TetR family transcriptional regulator [Bacteroidales bacterium]|nr:TetR/AcrR family transcriptional regulator [Parabacteroides sp.]MDY5622798.1 TetR family transcriptional regulator [Bacteroidales bacterium]